MNARFRFAQHHDRSRLALALIAMLSSGVALADDPTPDPAEPYFVSRAAVSVDRDQRTADAHRAVVRAVIRLPARPTR